ncbi:hypothetical protein [Halosimplex sp. TS25]|uniref:hypothetical protein n=1 Tax=Halosimplex rarum TaxID=3396619 RepID=UPI0039E83B91
MADDALQRTIRRCVALVLIPPSVLVIQFDRFMQAEAYGYQLHPVLSVLVPGTLVVGAAGYLVLSTLQIDRPESADRQSGDPDEGDADSAAESA